MNKYLNKCYRFENPADIAYVKVVKEYTFKGEISNIEYIVVNIRIDDVSDIFQRGRDTINDFEDMIQREYFEEVPYEEFENAVDVMMEKIVEFKLRK